MKNRLLMAGITAAVLSLASCAEKKEASADGDQAIDTTAVTADTTAVEADTVATTDVPAEEAAAETITATGKVTEINKGKDGYSATLQAEDGKTYTATISIPNMTDPKKYRSVAVGDKITVTGELHDTFIVVRDLK